MKERKVWKIDVGSMSKKDAMNTVDPSGRMWRQSKLETFYGVGCVVCFVIGFVLAIL